MVGIARPAAARRGHAAPGVNGARPPGARRRGRRRCCPRPRRRRRPGHHCPHRRQPRQARAPGGVVTRAAAEGPSRAWMRRRSRSLRVARESPGRGPHRRHVWVVPGAWPSPGRPWLGRVIHDFARWRAIVHLSSHAPRPGARGHGGHVAVLTAGMATSTASSTCSTVGLYPLARAASRRAWPLLMDQATSDQLMICRWVAGVVARTKRCHWSSRWKPASARRRQRGLDQPPSAARDLCGQSRRPCGSWRRDPGQCRPSVVLRARCPAFTWQRRVKSAQRHRHGPAGRRGDSLPSVML